MKKIAFVVQRYGLEVNGGAELYCRLVAEKLTEYYSVEVLTTCAQNYVTWENKYKKGQEVINGVTVRRFNVNEQRNNKKFNEINTYILQKKNHSLQDELLWMEEQGPFCPELIHYIRENIDVYHKFIFIPYLYYTTYFGIQEVFKKSILIPAAHDEPYIYFNIFDKIFSKTGSILYLTEEEKAFVEKRFPDIHSPSDIIGTGIDVPNEIRVKDFFRKNSINNPYCIYVGRIDESKGCKELFDYFIRYKKENPSNLKLVLMGKAVLQIPVHDDILYLGFVTEEDKFAGIKGAKFLILPSKYESLSLSALESLAVGTPIIVNENSEVLKGHCIKSNAGLYYKDYYEFCECIEFLNYQVAIITNMQKESIKYINNNYNWNRVKDKLIRMINTI